MQDLTNTKKLKHTLSEMFCFHKYFSSNCVQNNLISHHLSSCEDHTEHRLKLSYCQEEEKKNLEP